MTPEIEALLERLRDDNAVGDGGRETMLLCDQAADEIERLYMLAKANNGLARMVTGQRDEQGAELRDTIARLTAELAMKDEALREAKCWLQDKMLGNAGDPEELLSVVLAALTPKASADEQEKG